MAVIRKISSSKGEGFMLEWYDLKGQRRRRRIYGISLQTAKRLAHEIDYKKSRVITGLDKNMGENFPFEEAVKIFHDLDQKKQVSKNRELVTFDAFSAFIGNKKIRDIHKSDITAFFEYKLKVKKNSRATVGADFRNLRRFFNFFVEHEYLERSPLKGIKEPKKTNHEILFLTDQNIEDLIDTIKVDIEDWKKKEGDHRRRVERDWNKYLDIVEVYLNTGARRVELLPNNFIWDNVNFETRKLELFGKGDKSRVVPMNNRVYEILWKRYHEMGMTVPFDISPDRVTKVVKQFMKDAGIPGGNIQALRRTFGSRLVQNGVDLFRVSKLLGHSSIKVTEKYYASLLPDHLQEAVDTLL